MPEANTPKIDILNRTLFIHNVINIIKMISANKGNMTFAINGEWGCGKTFVLEEIQRLLDLDTEYDCLVIPYNCWQYDYYEEPLIAIVSTLLDCLKKAKKIPLKKKEKIIAVAKQLGKAALSVGAHYVEQKTKLDLGNEVDAIKDIADGVDEAIQIDDKAFDTHFELKNSLEKLKKALSDLSMKKAIILCVDELDRCVPEYAIKVLERLHHISEKIPNMITIIAVDEERLKHTIGSIFDEANAKNYLKKFIRFEMSLGNGKQDNAKFFDKFSDFYNRFDPNIYKGLTKTHEFLDELFLGIDMRTKEQIVEKASITNDICFGKNKHDHTIMYMELFYSTLYYHYKASSIFQENKSISNTNSRVFSNYPDCNNIFTNEDTGFIIPMSNPYPFPSLNSHVVIDTSNIYEIVFYYWYRLPQKSHDFNEGESIPIISQSDSKYEIIKENLNILKKYLHTLQIIN